MKFSKDSRDLLREMGICPESYRQSLVEEFGDNAASFDVLIESFREAASEAISTESFNDFCTGSGHQSDAVIHNKLYDLFNYLRLFKQGGKFGLYKGRQAEWDGPVVTLENSDVPSSDVDLLPESGFIYRGMSTAEFGSGRFGQSWTTDVGVAKRFAFEVYGDKPPGVIAVASLKKANVIFYSKDDAEKEVIVVIGSIDYASKFDA